MDDLIQCPKCGQTTEVKFCSAVKPLVCYLRYNNAKERKLELGCSYEAAPEFAKDAMQIYLKKAVS